MKSQSQNPEFRNNPDNFHPCFPPVFAIRNTASSRAVLLIGI